MAIGGRELLKYGGMPEKPPPSRDTWKRAGIVFLIGLVVIAVLFGCAEAGKGGRQFMCIVSGITTVIVFGRRILMGWQEDGIVGAYWANERPMGSMWWGDEERSPIEIVVWAGRALAAATAIACVMYGYPF